MLQAIRAGFDANYGLFTSTADGQAYPQPAATCVPNGLGLLEFLGTIVGKALYEGILLDVPLAPFFAARLQVEASIGSLNTSKETAVVFTRVGSLSGVLKHLAH